MNDIIYYIAIINYYILGYKTLKVILLEEINNDIMKIYIYRYWYIRNLYLKTMGPNFTWFFLNGPRCSEKVYSH